MQKRRRYNDLDIELMRQMYEDGKNSREIAEALCRSVGSVKNKMIEQGFYRCLKVMYTAGDLEIIRKMTEAGATVKCIASKLGRTEPALRTKIRKMGIKPCKPKDFWHEAKKPKTRKRGRRKGIKSCQNLPKEEHKKMISKRRYRTDEKYREYVKYVARKRYYEKRNMPYPYENEGR